MSQSITECGCSFQGEASATDFTNWLVQFFVEPRAAFYTQHSLKQRESGVCIAGALPASFALNDWEQGRVFNDGFELRWHVQDNGVSLLLLTEQEVPPAVCEALCVWQQSDDYEVASTRHMLVGTFYRQQECEWFFAEASVPRPFRYPVDTAGLTSRDRAHAILHGKHYRRGGRTVLTRFTHFGVERQRREGGERQ
jgi:hypothetical protein